ncbi:MAG: hypothetical protein ABI832_11610 [bacterium]
MWFLPAIGGALIGALITILIQARMTMRSMDVSALNDHIAQVTTIEGLAVDYWLLDGKNEVAMELASAARLRGTLDASLAFRPTAERLFAARFTEFKDADGELFDTATGGGFETVGRLVDPERAISVMQAANLLRGMLREQRRRIYWLH